MKSAFFLASRNLEKWNALFLVAELSSPFECLPNGEPIPGIHRAGTSYSPDSSPSPERFRSTSPPSVHPPLDIHPSSARMIVPPTKLPSSNRRGYGLEDLTFIRLISRVNPHRIFEFRRYTFTPDKQIKLRRKLNSSWTFEHMPTQEQIVVSTSDGDIFAILESTYVLAGIYINNNKRGKINMETGAVTLMTQEEINETPVGARRPILRYFQIPGVNRNPTK